MKVKLQAYKVEHDFSDAHYWHKRFSFALRAAIAGWVFAALVSGLLLAHLTNFI